MEENILNTTDAEKLHTDCISNDFYVVSPVKFYSLFICTLGLYGIYWFYKNWKLQKIANNESFWPIMRGIFYIFFIHSLFRRVNEKLLATEQKHLWDFESLATFLVVITVVKNVLDRLAMKNIGSPFTDLLAILLLPTIAVLLFKAQTAVNILCNDPKGESNSKFTPLNIIWIAMGTIVLVLGIIGLFFIEE